MVFGTWTTRMRAGRVPFERHRRERRVVAADRDELRDVEPQQRSNRVLEQLRVGRRIGARDADVRAAAEVNAADRFDGERHDVIDVALHDPLEPVADAEDVDAFEPGADGGRADDAVDAGRRAAADENRQLMVMLHFQKDGTRRPRGSHVYALSEMRYLKPVLCLAAITVVSAAPQQPQPIPSAPLAFGIFAGSFNADGTFAIRGQGWQPMSGTWKATQGEIELVAAADGGCAAPGRYRYRVEGTVLTFDLVADDCKSRRMILDRSSWRPAAEKIATPVRSIRTTTMAAGKSPLPAASPSAPATGRRFAASRRRASATARNCRIGGMAAPARTSCGVRRFLVWRIPVPSCGATRCSSPPPSAALPMPPSSPVSMAMVTRPRIVRAIGGC